MPDLFADHYGGKRPFLRYWLTQLKFRLGVYRPYSDVDFARVERLVFICMGNICRSPLAEYVSLAEGVTAISAGLSAAPGAEADPRAVSWAHSAGYDLSQHRSLAVKDLELLDSDLLVLMEPQQIALTREQIGEKASEMTQITLLGLWHPQPRGYIHDPFCATEPYFHACETVVQSAAKNLATRVKTARSK